MTDQYELLFLDETPTLRELARLLDMVLNRDEGVRKEGFILVRFGHERPGKPGFVTSCDDEQSIRILKLLLAQLEGRITGEVGNA